MAFISHAKWCKLTLSINPQFNNLTKYITKLKATYV